MAAATTFLPRPRPSLLITTATSSTTTTTRSYCLAASTAASSFFSKEVRVKGNHIQQRHQKSGKRFYHHSQLSPIARARELLPRDLPAQFLSQLPERLRPEHAEPKIIVPIKSGPSIKKICPDPVAEIQAAQMALLDPTGVRTRMFDYKNREGAKVGDILHTTFKTGEPFSGVIMSIKSRRQDTSVLVRNRLTHVGAEMSIKVFSPNVASMEIVQRSQKRKRRARLYYLRQPKHDIGSVDKIVEAYMRQKALLTGAGRASGRVTQGKGKKRGGKR